MKKLVMLLAGMMLMVALTAGSAFALPDLDPGFSWINAPFWTNTDKTTPPANGTSQFALTFEDASYESDFGLYTVTGTPENPGVVKDKFQIFAYNQEPVNGLYGPKTRQTVYFKSDGSISLDGIHFTSFDKVFGFYFFIHTEGINDPTADQKYYSYNMFNDSGEAGVDHILTAFNERTHEVLLFLDDQLFATGHGSDRDFNDMIVYGNDLAPVPEPSTLLLLGAGLAGLGFFGRRRAKK